MPLLATLTLRTDCCGTGDHDGGRAGLRVLFHRQIAGCENFERDGEIDNRKDSLPHCASRTNLNLNPRGHAGMWTPRELIRWTAMDRAVRTHSPGLDTGVKMEREPGGAKRTQEQRLFLLIAVSAILDAVEQRFGWRKMARTRSARETDSLVVQARQQDLRRRFRGCWCGNNEGAEQAAARIARFTMVCSGSSIFFWPQSYRHCSARAVPD